MNAEWFAARLRELREQSGLTQQQLADAAGLTREGVAQLETGRREPAWRTVVALCQALSVTADAFLQEPDARPDAKRGRPRKASTDANGQGATTAKKTSRKRKMK
jgi:transcriptional regulator with XRE-family HTH domain